MANSVFIPTASSSGGVSATYGAAFPATGTPIGATDGTNFQPLKVDGAGNLLIAGSLATTPPAAGTSTLSNVNASASSVTVLAANASRLGFNLYNDSTISGFLKTGTTASATSFTLRFLAGQSISSKDLGCDNYTGRIDAIWDSASGVMRVSEFTT